MSDKLELKVVFAAIDKFLRPVKAITQGASEAAKAFRENTARLKELNRTVEQIDAFKRLEKDAAITANVFAANKRRLDELKVAMAAAGVPTREMATEFDRLSKKSEDLKNKHQALTRTEQQLFEKLKAAGIDTRNLAEQRQRLASASADATNASRKFSAALDAENQKMRRLHAAQANLEKSKALSSKLAMGGAGITAGGVAVGLPVGKATKDFAEFETAMLGVARQVEGAKDANGKLTASYYEIGDAIKTMSERSEIGQTANNLAAIVEAGARMGIQGKANLLIFSETTAVMADAFSLPVDQVGDDIGKISQLYKIPIKDIRALGDTINWLDDNALSKGGEIIDVMKRIAGTADMVHMSFRDAAALGSTFLSLGAAPEIAATASNAMMRELSIATMQTKRFREGLGMLKMDAKAIQIGMNQDATGTIIKVLEAIKALPAESQLEAATRLFGKEFGDDAAKLASNLDEYRRQLKLVNDEAAKGSMQREADTRGATLNARIAAAKNALTNLSSDLGQSLKPALVETMERTLAIVQGVRNWAKENPQLASGLMSVAKWLAIGLTVLGGLTLAASAILVPLAMMKFGLAAIGITSGGAATGLLALLAPIAKVAAAFAVGYAAGTLLNAGINAGLSSILGYETTLGASLFDLVEGIKEKFGNLVAWFKALPQRLSEAGAAMIDGLINGFQQRWDALKSVVVGIADGAIGWFKDKLGIHSPSRVFAQLGGYTMEGFEQGLTGAIGGPLGAVSSLAKQLAGVGAGVVIGGSALAGGIPLDTRPPLSPSAMAASAGGDTYHITIQAAPGADNKDLAAELERLLERIEARKAASRRSRLRDPD